MDTRFTSVADALRAGNRTEAVRLLREITGMSMSEANDAVNQIAMEDPTIAAATAARESSGLARSDAGPSASASAGSGLGSGTVPFADADASEGPRSMDDSSSSLERSLRALRAANAAGVSTTDAQIPTQSAKAVIIVALAIFIAITGFVLSIFFIR